MIRNTYVYRLDVTYPEGSEQPGWEPADWREGLAVDLGRGSAGDGYTPEWCADFTWPRRRTYISAVAAERRKALLERLGAKVTVVRSAPVTWPKVAS